ncbi:hypothetical protein AN958_06206 [Leucoagaricus sp. SymC.cos]|nr:hypothetical protein AN958_06206 [Leucoagaricus sp. SymC.cos]
MWVHLKEILSDDVILGNFLKLANAYLEIGCWPSHSKKSVFIVISKPKKSSYSTPKLFRPIVLLNMIGKLVEKMLSACLQFNDIKYDIFYSNQLSSIQQRSTKDAGLFLTYLVKIG